MIDIILIGQDAKLRIQIYLSIKETSSKQRIDGEWVAKKTYVFFKSIPQYKVTDYRIRHGYLMTLSLNISSYYDYIDELFNIEYINELIIKNGYSIRIPHLIFFLKTLRSLKIIGGGEKIVLPLICRLKNLRKLVLLNNGLEMIPPGIFDLRHLNHLDLSINKITNIPFAIQFLTKLKVLNLNSNKLSKIPPEIGDLKSLIYLNLSNNLLQEIPDELCDLPDLLELNVGLNKIDEIPISILCSDIKIIHYSDHSARYNIEDIDREIDYMEIIYREKPEKTHMVNIIDHHDPDSHPSLNYIVTYFNKFNVSLAYLRLAFDDVYFRWIIIHSQQI